jgi:hypothetical protein
VAREGELKGEAPGNGLRAGLAEHVRDAHEGASVTNESYKCAIVHDTFCWPLTPRRNMQSDRSSCLLRVSRGSER